MKTFADAAGRNWTIALNLGTAITVKDELGIDLLQPETGDPPLLTRLGTDELLLGQVLCTLLEGQFEANNVSEQDVRAGFDGETLLNAQKAFYQELIDFFHSRGRADRARAVETQMRLIDAAVQAVQTRIDELDVDAVIRGAMSGSSPEAWASIPGP